MFRFAIMGAGNIANKFVEAARMAGAEIAAVASRTQQKADDFAAKYGIAHAYGSYEELLKNEKIDCVYIATVPSSHFDISMLCLKYRVPVICEKAMFRNAAEAERAFAYAVEQKTFIMEALWSKFLPANKIAKKWLEEGRIGRPVFCQTDIGFCAPRDNGNRYFNPDLGGGAALDITVYAYEISSFMLGAIPEIDGVQVARYETGVDASEQVAMRAGDCLCLLRTSFMASMTEGLTITGENGRIVVPWPHFASEVFLYDNEGSQTDHFKDEETKNGFVYEIQEVMECVSAGRIESAIQPHAATIECAKLFDRIASA